MRSKALHSVLFVAASAWVMGLLAATGPTADAVTIDWVTVRGSGNACDP